MNIWIATFRSPNSDTSDRLLGYYSGEDNDVRQYIHAATERGISADDDRLILTPVQLTYVTKGLLKDILAALSTMEQSSSAYRQIKFGNREDAA